MYDTTPRRSDPDTPSGRFVLRIDPELHASLREAARQSGVSLNEYCARKLALQSAALPVAFTDAVARAVELTGNALLGVVAYGSWARDEMADLSDIDLLIVVDSELAVDRRLYGRWDESPLRCDGHVVEPHFVHLPGSTERISSTWAEVAVDGIVLFERDLLVSRMLVGLRHQIVSGRLVRRHAHGQSYWVEAA